MEPILRVVPKGGTRTTIAKLADVLMIITANILIFVTETLLIFGFCLGFLPLFGGIQLFEGSQLVPYVLSTGGYLALSVLSK